MEGAVAWLASIPCLEQTATQRWSIRCPSCWGVGGVEATAAALGQPVVMKLPEVMGVRLHNLACQMACSPPISRLSKRQSSLVYAGERRDQAASA